MKSYVIFRNCENKKLTSLEELKNELEDTSFLEETTFKTGFSHDIVSNKVGANKVARRAAKAWMAESAGEKVSAPAVKKVPIVKETPIKKETPKKIERVSSNPPVADAPVELPKKIERVSSNPPVADNSNEKDTEVEPSVAKAPVEETK